MIALLKKDWRVYRAPVIGGIVLLVTPYVIGGIALLFERTDRVHDDVRGMMMAASMVDFWLAAGLTAVFGGAAFALERREHSADFQAMMPTTRARIIASKLIVASSCVATMWLVIFAILAAACWNADHTIFQERDWTTIVMAVTVAVMLFGVAWLLSTFLSSPAISASISIGVTAASMVLIMMLAQAYTERKGANADDLAYRVITGWTMCMGILTLIAGTIYYSRRIEP